VVQCLVKPDKISYFTDFMFSELNTLGIRHRIEARTVLTRRIEKIPTVWGEVAVKAWQDPDGGQRFAPEYESCKTIAKNHGLPLVNVYHEVIRRAMESFDQPNRE
jgi:uncharacterized protein (DUF111 family)